MGSFSEEIDEEGHLRTLNEIDRGMNTIIDKARVYVYTR